MSEHSRVFVGSANRSSVFPGQGRALVKNEGAARVSCCGSFFMRRNRHKNTSWLIGIHIIRCFSMMLLFEIILNI